MYIYIDEKGYVYGYGSEEEEGSIKVDSVPEEVDRYLGAYKYIEGEYVPNNRKITYLEETRQLGREMEIIQSWLIEYDKKCAEYARNQRLGLSTDINIEELDSQAKSYVERLSEIQKLLSVPFTEDEGE